MLRLFVATCARQGLASRTSSNQFRKPSCNFVIASKWMSSEPTEPYDPSEPNEPTIPPFIEKFEEPIVEKRARLLYQSRKRGMLENGLLLGSFANKYLADFNEEQLVLYDRLINLPSNDWDIFKWATENLETPEEFQTEVMDLLKEHAKNKHKESRVMLPSLPELKSS